MRAMLNRIDESINLSRFFPTPWEGNFKARRDDASAANAARWGLDEFRILTRFDPFFRCTWVYIADDKRKRSLDLWSALAPLR
jgi:hypothetical protein